MVSVEVGARLGMSVDRDTVGAVSPGRIVEGSDADGSVGVWTLKVGREADGRVGSTKTGTVVVSVERDTLVGADVVLVRDGVKDVLGRVLAAGCAVV